MITQCKSLWWIFLQFLFTSVNFMVIFSLGGMNQQLPTIKETQQKASFIFNVTQFMNWGELVQPADTLVIGILKDDTIAEYIEELARREKDVHPTRVELYNAVDEVNNCHVLFINETNDSNTQDILNQLGGKHILTIGQSFFFIKMGGMMRIYTSKDKTKLQINLDQINKESFTVSSKLLRIAEVFGTAKN